MENIKQLKKENKELVSFAQVENTPFTIGKVQQENSDKIDYHVLMGNTRIYNRPFNSEEEALEKTKPSWENLIPVIATIAKDINENKDI